MEKRARDHRAAYRRRDELARARGFRSYWEQRQLTKRITTEDDYLALPQKAREQRGAVVRAIDRAARKRTSIEEAASGISKRELRFWTKGATARRNGKTYPVARDNLLRLRIVAVDNPPEFITIATHSRREALRADRDFRIQWQYLHNRSTPDQVRALKGHWYRGRPVLSDPDKLARLGFETDLDDIIRGT